MKRIAQMLRCEPAVERRLSCFKSDTICGDFLITKSQNCNQPQSGLRPRWATALLCVLVCMPLHAREARDQYGDLQLQDCAHVADWLHTDGDGPRDSDLLPLLDWVFYCAKTSNGDTSRLLLTQTATLAQPPLAEWVARADARRAQALFMLGEFQQAAALADRASTHILVASTKVWDTDTAGIAMVVLSGVHQELAERPELNPAISAAHLQMSERLDAARVLLVSTDSPTSKIFRNPYGELLLPSCETALRWLKIKPQELRPQDTASVLSAARLCAVAGQQASARQLLAVSETIAIRDDGYDRSSVFSIRADVFIALDDWPAASTELFKASDEIQEAVATPALVEEIKYLTISLALAHHRVASALATRDPEDAIKHYLLAAQLEEVTDNQRQADASRMFAQSLLLQSGELDRAVNICRGWLVSGAGDGLGLTRLKSLLVGATLGALLKADRVDAALSLAQQFKHTQWAGADAIADPIIQHARRTN